ncbi:LANO_0H03994g1_1 [Lachancea nothofagi CBS 11611]|uniref:LANO_0H03994g1_1 n=1 Tax=Lachancea nothofagi CBS 11611 TaxID=1266666 RepID=A0A1G4KLC5_9SACH|nr:LANO_0H03994g1_1 [Lachancea nothofagi CBS 11611]
MDPFSKNQSNLPSYEHRLASESRVARINELYNKSQKHNIHRDSIISDASTSVPDIHNGIYTEDNCQPLINLPHNKAPDLPLPVQQETVTIKPEVISNPFRPRLTEVRPRSKDEMEKELQFTPKLRSRRSIISSRTPSHGSPPSVDDNHKSRIKPRVLWTYNEPRTIIKKRGFSDRRRESYKGLKERLGKPLPLGYLSPEDQNGEERGTQSQKKDLESRWRRILSSREAETSHKSNTSWQKSRSPSEDGSVRLHKSDSGSSLQDFPDEAYSLEEHEGQILTIHESIRTNTEKLDQIIALLDDHKKTDSKREITAWIICIIILVGLNLYMVDL